jgi:GH3 auxin-responsive promoter
MPTLMRRGVRRVLQFLLFRVGKLVAWPVRRRLAEFEAATHRPREVQEALLRDILAHQADTAFGRDHRFGDIRTRADFRRQLPVAPYDYFEPYLARVRRGETRALLADARIHMFALTSGTTATRKYIPVTDQYLRDYRRGWNLWGLRAFRDHPEVKLRPIVQLSGDWDEYRTEAGIPCGSVTGLTATMQKRLIRWLYCVPACVGRVKDPAAKYYVALRLSLPRPVALVIAANPSTLINLARAGDREKESLIRDIHDGTLSPHLDVPAEVRQALRRRLRRHPERARELEAIAARTGTLYPRDYWPEHLLLGNWTGGSVGAYLRHYPRYFGDRVVRDVGLIASEGRMTIPVRDGTPSGILDVTTHYFEFIPEEEGDSARPTVLGAHELREGGRYYILLTTAFGLYRYHIHDLVRVTGFYNQTPLIEFLSKGAHFSNLTGEKLSEYQVTQSMAEVLRELDLTLTAYSLAPCWPPEEGDYRQPYYGLFVEQSDLADPGVGQRLAERLDARLRAVNLEYAGKRDSLRLGPVRVELLRPGAWAQWDRERLRRTGGTPEQYKHPCLIGDTQFRERMSRDLCSVVSCQ